MFMTNFKSQRRRLGCGLTDFQKCSQKRLNAWLWIISLEIVTAFGWLYCSLCMKHTKKHKKNVVKQKCIYSVKLYLTGKLKSYTLQSLLLPLTGLPSDSSCSLQEVHILLSKPHKQSFLFMSLSFNCHSSDPLCTFVHMRWFCTSHMQNEGCIPVYHIG